MITEKISLITVDQWNEVGSGNGYWGDTASVHSAYQGAYSDVFTFTIPQKAGDYKFTFYGAKQSNFRLSYYIYATIDGTEQLIFQDTSTYQTGGNIHGLKTVSFNIPYDFGALRVYTSFRRVNSTYCFGGLGMYQLVQL